MYTLGWWHRLDAPDAGIAMKTWHRKEGNCRVRVRGCSARRFRDLHTPLVRSQSCAPISVCSQVTDGNVRAVQPGAGSLHTRRRPPAKPCRHQRDGGWWKRAIPFRSGGCAYARVPTHSFAFVGADKGHRGSWRHEAIETPESGLLAAYNPVVRSARFGLPGIRATTSRSEKRGVIGYSPSYGGKTRGEAWRRNACPGSGEDSTSEAVGAITGYARGRHLGRLDGAPGGPCEIDGVEVRSVRC